MGLFTGCTDAPPPVATPRPEKPRKEPPQVAQPALPEPAQPEPAAPDELKEPAMVSPPRPSPAANRYVPPETSSFPEEPLDAGFYHPYFVLGERRIRGAYPTGLQCPAEENRCYFGLRNKIYSFPTSDLQNNDPVPALLAADFSSELDGQERQLSNILVSGGYFYGLYDNFNENFPEAGIVVRDPQGRLTDHYFFPRLEDNSSVSCPHTLFPAGNEIWATASNCVGDNDFKPGKIFVLRKGEDGTLENAESRPVTTTQRNPQAIAGWNANNRTYLLAVNTGVTTRRDDEIFSESGVDVIDAETRLVIANIPLGKAAANTITLSGDNTRAFLGSQNRPYAYAIDLEWLEIRLGTLIRSAGTPILLHDVVIADATNPMRLADVSRDFIPSIRYNDRNGTVLASSFNNSLLILLHTGADKPLGVIGGHYFCAKEGESEQCSDIALIDEGALVLTNLPNVGVTFFPDALWSR